MSSSRITILPAIDLKNGQCVRLRQGRADDATVYSSDPVEMALHWEQEGGMYLHIVDLDGAFAGQPAHREVIGRIAQALTIPFEVGGGLRTDQDIEQMLSLGADRVILGTRACDSPETLGELTRRYGERLAVGIDARDGMVQTRGWTETTSMRATDLTKQLCDLGVRTIIYTDTARDGMLGGVNADAMAMVCDAAGSAQVIASGGVSSAGDVRRLLALQRANLTGAIVGKALYEKQVTIQELRSVA
jgi:phosphoribosylformimino-5-aminoimidazole carboxamide ribotide isomerase